MLALCIVSGQCCNWRNKTSRIEKIMFVEEWKARTLNAEEIVTEKETCKTPQKSFKTGVLHSGNKPIIHWDQFSNVCFSITNASEILTTTKAVIRLTQQEYQDQYPKQYQSLAKNLRLYSDQELIIRCQV
ncbi:Hypothetical predicted protein [Octopus vulgaris]|uniref:Uncharacterized protein n=1 Tax=Octopus vulgaris TaxID=6645 RepID=A0AA36BR31_OCTVU|nr:Hypothetical predicted protein [Octopus vulgaris]